jgi:hypothetical protein
MISRSRSMVDNLVITFRVAWAHPAETIQSSSRMKRRDSRSWCGLVLPGSAQLIPDPVPTELTDSSAIVHCKDNVSQEQVEEALYSSPKTFL